MTDTNWSERTADLLVQNLTDHDGPLLRVEQEADGYVATHTRTATTATSEANEQVAITRLLRKLADRSIAPLSQRLEMSRASVDDLDGVLDERAPVTRAAIADGYIDVWHDRIACTDIPAKHWLAVSDDISTIDGGEVHTTVAGIVEAFLRWKEFQIFAYEDNACYAPDTGVKADIALPHAGIYVEVAGHEGVGLSDDPDKIAGCLDVGRDTPCWTLIDPVVAESQYIYHDPPKNLVNEIVYVPWFEDAELLGEKNDVTVPVYVFSRTDKELRQRRR